MKAQIELHTCMIANHELIGARLRDGSIDNLQPSLRFFKHCGEVAFILANDRHDSR